MYFDAHAHFDDEQFDTDRELLIPQMHSFGVDYIINAGSDYETSIKSIALSEKYPFIYAAVGVHPENADFPIVVTYFPIVIFVISLLFLNAFAASHVTLYLMPSMVTVAGMAAFPERSARGFLYATFGFEGSVVIEV